MWQIPRNLVMDGDVLQWDAERGDRVSRDYRMFDYYLSLAARSLTKNAGLTALMVVAIGVGIGASMTTLAVFRAMSGDPIPSKSSQLYVVQIDNWGPDKPDQHT